MEKILMKITSSALALAMMLGMSTSVFAENSKENEHELITEYVHGEKVVLDENAQFFTTEVPATYGLAEINAEKLGLKDIPNFPQLSGKKLDGDIPMSLAESVDDFRTSSFSDIIAEQGALYFSEPLYLVDGEYIQGRLDIPQEVNLDYDLYLYKFDMTTGDIITTPVDYSLFTTTNQFIPESVGGINSSGGVQAYAIAVHAAAGSSTTDTFTLTVSITNPGIADPAESNENAFTATDLGVSIAANDTFKLSSTNVNSNVDSDWFMINVPSVADFKYLSLSAVKSDADRTPVDLQIQTYYAKDGTTLVKGDRNSKGDYSVVAGVNYIKVSAKATTPLNGKKLDYMLLFSAQNLICTNGSYVMKREGKPWSTKTYEKGGTRYAFGDRDVINWDVTYLSPNGYKCYNVNDVLYMKMVDYAWSEGSMWRTAISDSPYDVINGTAYVKMQIMPGFSQVSLSPLFYDYSVFLTMHSQKFGYVANEMPVFITSRMDYN